jgi:nitroreductase
MTAMSGAIAISVEASATQGRSAPAGSCTYDAAAAALEFLGQRHSVGPKYLTEPAPGLEALRHAAKLALRAPDHRHLRPFRFLVVAEAERPHLAVLFAQDAARRGHGAVEVERARERAWNGPALVALIGRVRPNVDDVPDSEQWICVGAGLMNFVNALHLMGFGTKVLSGASVRDENIRQAFCGADETVVAWIVAGTPRGRSIAKRDDDLEGAIAEWHPRSRVGSAD